MNETLAFWPAQASSYAREVDRLVFAFSALILLLSIPMVVCLVVFMRRYRRNREVNREHTADRNVWLEVSWTAIPFFLLLVFYAWSLKLFVAHASAPADALEITVLAKRWMWKVQHPGGQAEIDALHVPVGRPVKLVMASEDVIHDFFVPALRLKQDVVPGRLTSLWFEADKIGIYRLACSQFCGTDHSTMIGEVRLLSPQDYAAWLDAAGSDATLAQRGAELFRSLGCSGCHSAGSTVRAPRLEGVFGRRTPLADGSVVVADDQYLRDSIVLPRKQIVAGFEPVMPTFANLVSEADLMALVAHLKSLKVSVEAR